MRLGDYIHGLPVRGHSSLPVEACVSRIAAAKRSLFSFDFSVPAGRVTRKGYLRLSNWRPMGYSGKPILTGDLVPEKGGTGFILTFGAPASTLFSFGCMSLGMLLFLALILTGIPAPGRTTVENVLTLAGFFTAMIAAMWLFHLSGTRNAMEDLDELLRFLEKETGATFEPLPAG